MRAQKITLAAVALAAGLSLTACQGNDTAASADDSGSSSSPSAGNSGSSDGTSGGSGTSDENAKTAGDDSNAAKSGEGSGNGQITTGTCKTANLDFSTAHGMAEGNLMVTLKNTGEACSLKGFPGVDLKADNGPGGISAERTELAAPAVALKSGEETRFTLHYPRNDTGGSGVDITRMDVTPPNETHAKSLPVSINLPASDKAVGTVTVDPVGTGKQ